MDIFFIPRALTVKDLAVSLSSHLRMTKTVKLCDLIGGGTVCREVYLNCKKVNKKKT